jgi:hypothetical protein
MDPEPLPWPWWALFLALCVMLALLGGLVWDAVQALAVARLR